MSKVWTFFQILGAMGVLSLATNLPLSWLRSILFLLAGLLLWAGIVSYSNELKKEILEQIKQNSLR